MRWMKMMKNKAIFAIFMVASGAQAQVQNSQHDIEQQWLSGEFNKSELKARYNTYCHDSDFEIEASVKAQLCELTAQELVDSTVKVGLSLDQFIVENACEEDDDYEDCFSDPSQLLQDSIRDALAVSLCELQPTLVKNDSDFIQKIASKIYFDMSLVFDCEAERFAYGYLESRAFSARSSAPDEITVPRLIEWLSENIDNDNEYLFLQNIKLVSPDSLAQHGSYLLWSAVASKNEIYLNTLLSHGVDVNAVGNYFDQPIFHALNEQNDSAVAALLEAGAEADVYAEYEGSALLLAVKNSSMGIVEKLLNHGAAPDGQKKDWHSSFTPPLFIAAELGRSDVVSALLASGATVEPSDLGDFKFDWLKAAAQGGREDIFNALVENGASLSEQHLELIEAALKGGNVQILKKIFSLGAKLNVGDSETILKALWQFSLGHFHYDYSVRDSRYLQEPQLERVAQLDVLLAHGLQLNSKEYSAQEFVSNLVSPYRNPAKAINPKVARAYIERQNLALKSIEVALAGGLEINQLNKNGFTLLIIAARAENLGAVEKLLELGADVEIKDKNSKTARDYVALELAKKLDRTPDKTEEIAEYRRTYELLGGKFADLPPAPKRKKSLLVEIFKAFM